MVARAVMKAWRESLDSETDVVPAPNSDTRGRGAKRSAVGWERPPSNDMPVGGSGDFRPGESDAAEREHCGIVPRRPLASSRPAEPATTEGFWKSHHFWKGVVVGALIVLLVKTVIAVQAPYGIGWYGF